MRETSRIGDDGSTAGLHPRPAQCPGDLADRRASGHDVVHDHNAPTGEERRSAVANNHRFVQIGQPVALAEAGLVSNPAAVPCGRYDGAGPSRAAHDDTGPAGDAEQWIVPAPESRRSRGRRRHERYRPAWKGIEALATIEQPDHRCSQCVAERSAHGEPAAFLVFHHHSADRTAIDGFRRDS
jgi:hypothetical protein